MSNSNARTEADFAEERKAHDENQDDSEHSLNIYKVKQGRERLERELVFTHILHH